jgi:magnesium transporter
VAEVVAIVADVRAEVGAAVLRRMTAASAAACLVRLRHDRVKQLLALLPVDSTATLLRLLSEEERSSVVQALPRRIAEPLRRLLAYPEGTAGSVMDPNVFVIANDVTVRAARARLRRDASTALYYLYVVDRSRKLVGVLTLRELMLAAGDLPIVSVMRGKPVSIEAAASHLDLLRHNGWRSFHAIPVVDADNVLLGVVRYETIRKLEAELTGTERRQGGLDLALSLSELYVKGLTGLVNGLVPRAPAGAHEARTPSGEDPS